VLGLRVEGISVDDISCVAKTFPEFADAWTALVS
jgi:5-enolpyruvylshikimate-3-phosphate synthase